ncbi:unnamed protein product [Linum trigynum]|uniref:Uncharacterized protein n=1 Tax=Linum trigynum TaxID=586398 RepID=A0AAV2E3T2_9ROSI
MSLRRFEDGQSFRGKHSYQGKRRPTIDILPRCIMVAATAHQPPSSISLQALLRSFRRSASLRSAFSRTTTYASSVRSPPKPALSCIYARLVTQDQPNFVYGAGSRLT